MRERGGRGRGRGESEGERCVLLYSGLLSPLDCPHHMRQDKESPYREGIVLDIPDSPGTLVDCGLPQVRTITNTSSRMNE